MRGLLWAAALLACIAAVGSIGGPLSPVEALGVVLRRVFVAGWAPALYLISGVGLAGLMRPLWRDASDPIALRVVLGLGISLTLSKVLGSVGLLAGAASRVVVIGLAAGGVAMLLWEVRWKIAGRGAESATDREGSVGVSRGGTARPMPQPNGFPSASPAPPREIRISRGGAGNAEEAKGESSRTAEILTVCNAEGAEQDGKNSPAAEKRVLGSGKMQGEWKFSWDIAAALIALVPIAVLLVAACSPPGWLWDSEFGGFDALSYHLQLPQEWIARGRVEPLSHNVYSYLPSYVEAAFVHVGVLAGASATLDAEGRMGLLAGSGEGVISCQLLHAFITLIGAWLLSRSVPLLAASAQQWWDSDISHAPSVATPPTTAAPEDGRAVAHDSGAVAHSDLGAVARSIFVFSLATPWVLVVGSLAYNEMAMIALFAGAMIAAGDARISAGNRGAIAGLLVGAACGAKPTAMLFAGLPVGIVLLGTMPARLWWRAIVAGAAAGLVVLAPWLLRNFLANGNPVFPALCSLFGDGHWSAEQVGRFAREHQFQGGWLERFKLLALPDVSDPAGPRHRGLLHGQWFAFFPIVGAASAGALLNARTHRLAALLVCALLAQLAVWLFTTHLQSRFLLPLLVPGIMLIGLVVLANERRRFFRLVMIAAVLAQAGSSLVIFANQRAGHPNRLLALNPAAFAGGEVQHLDSGEREAVYEAFPSAFIARELPEGSRVLLLGDSTALYYPPGTVYATTWDSSVFVEATARNEPGEWAGVLRATGVTHVFANLAELQRLKGSAYLDPRLDGEAIQRWLGEQKGIVRVWPGGRVLVRL